MGTVVSLDAAERRTVARGVSLARLADGSEMQATLLDIAAGACYSAEVPAGCDEYLFGLSGEVQIEAASRKAPIGRETFAIVEEGCPFTLTGGAAPTRLLSVLVPPPDAGRSSPGFRDGLKVMAVAALPIVDLPEEKKRRTYLANPSTVGSERGHAMIVRYTGETVTRKHHHPNAESMFVMLDGYVRFLVNGNEETLGPGQAVHFPIDDRHALRSADGQPLSFLEFHVPGRFVTQYDD